MSSLTVNTIEQLARDYSQDNDATTANYSFPQATFWRLFNRFYIRHKATAEDRFQELGSGTTGFSFSSNVFTLDSSNVNMRKIISLYPTGMTSGSGAIELEHLSISDMNSFQRETNTDTYPTSWAGYRLGTATGASVGKWRVIIWPPYGAGTISMKTVAEIEPTAITAGTDIPDLSDLEGYGLAAVCGAFMAVRMGRMALAQDALADVPQTMGALVANIKNEMSKHVEIGREVG